MLWIVNHSSVILYEMVYIELLIILLHLLQNDPQLLYYVHSTVITVLAAKL